jgi:Thaumatin family
MVGCGGDDDGGQPPMLAPIGNRTVVLGSDLLIAVSAEDPEGQPVTLSASGLPENAYFLPHSGIFCLFGDREAQVGQPITVTFTASDGALASSQTITVTVVRPDASTTRALAVLQDLTLDPIGDHAAPAGETLTLQLSAHGASPITYRMYPEPALAPLVTLDSNTGQFHFSPTAAQVGKEFEITFQACVPDGAACSAIMQLHETAHLTVAPGTSGSCEAARSAFEATLPLPVPVPGHYVVQLVNESGKTLLAAANAAHVVNQPPKSVLPREGTWVIGPKSVLTVDIPEEWESTIPKGSVGPVFWARTGCRYDIDHNFAQCETGDCGGVYDCSKAGRTPPGPKSLAEWTFKDPNNNSAPDISVVDGVNLNMDIEPVGPHSDTPVGPVDSHFWLGAANLPLTKCGGDLRAACPSEFQLRRDQLTFFIQGSEGAEDVVGCFSNCGQYKFQGQLTGACPAGFRCAGEPPFSCNPDISTEAGRVCYYWKPFCTAVTEGDPDHIYGRPCTTDADCPQHGVCWNNGNPQSVCAPSAFNKNADCPPDVCTNQYSQKISFQPPFTLCSALTDATGRPGDCIGDDTFHEVMPRGLTWPNDPETYYSNAKAFRIIFAPGGTNVPITDSSPIPPCSTLPADYRYTQQRQSCKPYIDAGALFGGARVSPSCTRYCSKDHNVPCTVDSDCQPNNGVCSSDCAIGGCNPDTLHCDSWECKVADGDASNAVLCRW